MEFLIIIAVLVVFIIFRITKTLNKIRVLRTHGINVSKKNTYYKFLYTVFLKNLPS